MEIKKFRDKLSKEEKKKKFMENINLSLLFRRISSKEVNRANTFGTIQDVLKNKRKKEK